MINMASRCTCGSGLLTGDITDGTGGLRVGGEAGVRAGQYALCADRAARPYIYERVRLLHHEIVTIGGVRMRRRG